MTCEAIDELLGAYTVAALSQEETEEVRAHLPTCRRHDDALAGLRAVVDRLPLAAPEREAPPALRARLLDAFDAEVAARRAPGRIDTLRAAPRWRFALRPPLAYAVAAALVLALLGLLSWNLALQLGGEEEAEATVVVRLSGAIGSGRVVYVVDAQVGVIELDLREPPARRVYQAWAIYEQGPASLGVVAARGVLAFEADLSDASAVAITEEPLGGSPQPTSDPLVVAALP